MAQNTQEIDIRLWCGRILKHWYWFVICCFVFGGLGLYNYFSSTKQYPVDARIMIRSNEPDMAMPQVEVMQMMGIGGSKQVEDEVAILTSRDILTQVVKDLDLQTEYRKKHHLRWEGLYPSRGLTVVYPDQFLDTTKKFVRIKLRVRKNYSLVRVQYGQWNFSRHRVKDITQPFATCAGEIYFKPHKQIKVGDKYNIFTLPILPAVDKYAQTIVAEPIKKESNVISISTITDMPQRAIDFINKEIDMYNQDALIDKNLMASNTASFIEDRLRLIENELSVAEAEVEQYNYDDTETYYCKANSLNVRIAPSTSAAVIGTIKKNQRIEVYDIQNGFARIDYYGSVGYVSADWISAY
jgi:hypothetical protein